MREISAAICWLIGASLVLVAILSGVSSVTDWQFSMHGTEIPDGPMVWLAFLVAAAFFAGLGLLLDRIPMIVAAARRNRGAAAAVGLALLVAAGFGINELRFLNQGSRLAYAAKNHDQPLLERQLGREHAPERVRRATRLAYTYDNPEALRAMHAAGLDVAAYFSDREQSYWIEGTESAAIRAFIREHALGRDPAVGGGAPSSTQPRAATPPAPPQPSGAAGSAKPADEPAPATGGKP